MSAVRTVTGERLSSAVLAPMPPGVDRRLLERMRPREVRPLAEPPAGSGLAPVPGDARPAGARAHAVLHPLRPRLHPRAPRGARAGVLVRVRRRGRGDRRRSGRHPRGAHQPGQGLLAGRVALPRRRLLPPRADAARRRRPPHPPAGHAGGLHGRPGPRLRRPHRPRAARDDPGLADRPAGAHLPDAQAPDPRRRHPRLHGRALRPGGRGGQPGVHGLRAGGQRDRAPRPARHPLPRRAAGPRPARALLHRGPAGQARR